MLPNSVESTPQVSKVSLRDHTHLQDLDLALDLLLLDWLQDLYDAPVLPTVRQEPNALKDLTVLATPDLAHDFIVILHGHVWMVWLNCSDAVLRLAVQVAAHRSRPQL